VLREYGIPIGVLVPEPNTWRDVLKALDERQPPVSLDGKRVALQEYGVSNRELIQGLEARGARVTPVPVYQWALPEDIRPLENAIQEIVDGRIDVLLVTSANQIHNLMEVAGRSGLKETLLQGLQRAAVVSIGPISSEALRAYGITPDLEPVHPKMGNMIHETAEKARALLRRKRSGGV
jgi:uroporphyrinogen-III synthase